VAAALSHTVNISRRLHASATVAIVRRRGALLSSYRARGRWKCRTRKCRTWKWRTF